MPESLRLALFEELEKLLKHIGPDDYIRPKIVDVPRESRVLGVATEQMKCLWTLWSRLDADTRLGDTELMRRAVHTAISFEIGQHFNCWRARVGMTSTWQVFAVTSQ